MTDQAADFPRMTVTLYLVEPEEVKEVETDARDRRELELNAERLGMTPGPVGDLWNRYPETCTAYVGWSALSRSERNLADFQTFSRRVVRTRVTSGGADPVADPTGPEQ